MSMHKCIRSVDIDIDVDTSPRSPPAQTSCQLERQAKEVCPQFANDSLYLLNHRGPIQSLKAHNDSDPALFIRAG
eukprot:scaffold10695_cov74-Skeletonema_marinoi.AAC.1